MFGVVEGIVAAARRNPATPALITGDQSLTYGQLLDVVARVSNHLVDRGISPRSKLFLNIANPDLRLVTTIAAIHAGFIPFAILDPAGMDGEVDHDFVVGADVLQLPDLMPDIVLDQAALGGKLSDGTLRQFPDPADNALALVVTTSGSTGQPKLVAFTHGCLRVRDEVQGLVPGEGYMAPTPWHPLMRDECIMATLGDVTYGGIASSFQALSAGATSVRASRDRPETVNLINRYRVGRITTTAGLLAEMMDHMDKAGIACPSIRHVALVGSLVDEVVVRRIAAHFDADIAMIYGATEVARISCGLIDPNAFEYGYVGDVFPEVRLVASGSAAEPARLAVIRDPATYAPYYAGGKIVPNDDTFYTLPDLGYVQGNRVYLVGRDDEVMNLSGNKVAYSVIDQALRNRAGVRDVAVVGAAAIGDLSGVIIGIVAEADVDLASLACSVAGIVKAPETAEHVHLFRLAEIPRNTFGKTDRARVVSAFRRQTDASGAV